MTVRQLMATLKKVRPDAIVVLRRGDTDDFSPLSGIDEAECRKNDGDGDGGVSEKVAKCIVLYLAR